VFLFHTRSLHKRTNRFRYYPCRIQTKKINYVHKVDQSFSKSSPAALPAFLWMVCPCWTVIQLRERTCNWA